MKVRTQDSLPTPPARLKPWQRRKWALAIAALLIALLSALALYGLKRVPFHPDESTQLFMSADMELFAWEPAALLWDSQNEADLRQRYRGLDAPLTRYLLGLGRLAAGLPALPVDWDWGASWQANQAAGALPAPRLLFFGRLAVTLLLPLTLFFVYQTGAALHSRLAGALAALFFGLNALTLLHLRRAMAEGALLFGISFALWSFIRADRRPWLAGLAVGLAVAAKQSALALLPVGLLAVVWGAAPLTNRRRAANALQYLAVFGLLTFALNPFLWRDPVGALRAALAARQDLTQRQRADAARLNPDMALDTPGKRALGLAAHLFFTPPAFAEVGNYTQATAAAEQAYLDAPWNNLGRGLVGGAILLFLTLFGFVTLALKPGPRGSPQRRARALFLLAALGQAVFVYALLYLPWQRYVVPLLPFTSLLAAYGLAAPLIKFTQGRAR